MADEELEVPVEAQGLSIFGANHVDGHARRTSGWSRTSWRTSGSATAVTIANWRHIWLNEGFAKYAEWLWSEVAGGRAGAGTRGAVLGRPRPAAPGPADRRPGRHA